MKGPHTKDPPRPLVSCMSKPDGLSSVTLNVQFHDFVMHTIQISHMEITNFKAGQIKNYYSNWLAFTSDKEILTTVKGCKLEFQQMPFQLNSPSSQNKFCLIRIKLKLVSRKPLFDII